RRRRKARQALRQTAAEGTVQDFALLEALESSRASPLELLLPRALGRLLFPRGIHALGLRTGASLVVAALISLGIASAISYRRNQDLRANSRLITQTLTGLSEQSKPEQWLPHLEALRQHLDTLERYARLGPPLDMCWGFYSGNELVGPVSRVYWGAFRRRLLEPAHASLLRELRGLPDSLAPNQVHDFDYNALKAYLILTAHPEHNKGAFLASVLMERWLFHRDLDAKLTNLARRQFDFYCDRLRGNKPFSIPADDAAIQRARRHLRQLPKGEGVYQSMLKDTSLAVPSVNFNRMFPGSDEVIVNSLEVPGAFTKAGWTLMTRVMDRADLYASEDRWVVGETVNIDQEWLRARYTAEYISWWTTFLGGTLMVGFTSLADASAKLEKLSWRDSPLRDLMWLVAANTSVDSGELARVFRTFLLLKHPEAARNEGALFLYMPTLLSLSSVAGSYGFWKEPGFTVELTKARKRVQSVFNLLRIDKFSEVDWNIRRLLEAPIMYLDAVLRSMPVKVFITSDPPGTKVFPSADPGQSCLTPCVLTVPTGKVSLVALPQRRPPFAQTVEAAEGARVELRFPPDIEAVFEIREDPLVRLSKVAQERQRVWDQKQADLTKFITTVTNPCSPQINERIAATKAAATQYFRAEYEYQERRGDKNKESLRTVMALSAVLTKASERYRNEIEEAENNLAAVRSILKTNASEALRQDAEALALRAQANTDRLRGLLKNVEAQEKEVKDTQASHESEANLSTSAQKEVQVREHEWNAYYDAQRRAFAAKCASSAGR
ncbi:MAG: hypothetical protein HYR60_18980, partial [Acidobacteria bacterium]|nr:hypothetical protein [Acidobacteriota bacterium]